MWQEACKKRAAAQGRRETTAAFVIEVDIRHRWTRDKSDDGGTVRGRVSTKRERRRHSKRKRARAREREREKGRGRASGRERERERGAYRCRTLAGLEFLGRPFKRREEVSPERRLPRDLAEGPDNLGA